MQKLSTLVAGALALSFSAHLSAQLSPVLVRSFVDTFAGGNGNIGITQDEAGFAYYVVAFQNPQTVHTFDIIGTPLTTFTSATCSPALPMYAVYHGPDGLRAIAERHYLRSRHADTLAG